MINIIATLRFNIKAFGLIRGLRLPVIVYGALKIRHIGTIRVHCPLRRRLIIIGNNHESVVAPYTVFDNQGTVDVYGRLFLNYGSSFINRGEVIFRGKNIVGNQTVIDIRHRLDVGFNTIFGFENHVADHDHHFMVDVETHRVRQNFAPITLGRFNWFGGNCFIKKGTVTPDYLTVASPCSMLSKDYTALPPHSVLAGCPARPVKQGVRRICNHVIEREVREHFLQHPDAEYYQVDERADLDEICELA